MIKSQRQFMYGLNFYGSDIKFQQKIVQSFLTLVTRYYKNAKQGTTKMQLISHELL